MKWVQTEEVKEANAQKMNEVALEAGRLRGLLEDCLRLQEFGRDSTTTKEWINHSIASMNDGSHLDPSNLNAKMENHKNHERDIMSRKPHMVEIVK